MATGGPVVEWSETTCSIREVVTRPGVSLPVMVKVDEGIYGESDSETFSQGDLLKLDCIKSIKKAVACCVDRMGQLTSPAKLREDEHGYVQRTDDLTIPLRYQGLLRVVLFHAGHKVYHSVSDLARDKPRYVKVIESFTDKNGKTLHSKEVIEVRGAVPIQGLVCNRIDENGKTRDTENLVLDTGDKHSFLLMPDTNTYTLAEVVKRFPLPQYVTFIENTGPKLLTTNVEEVIEHSKIFAGTVKIKKCITQEIIVGHYKPPESVAAASQRRCQRTLILIPLYSPTACDIDVRLPRNIDDDNDYELVMAKNFSHDNINEEDIDGTVYLDFLKTPKAALVEYDENKSPPPIPPKPKSERKHGKPTERTPPRPPPRSLSTSSQVSAEGNSRQPTKMTPRLPPKSLSTSSMVSAEGNSRQPTKRTPPRLPLRSLSTSSLVSAAGVDDEDPTDDYEEISELHFGLTDDDKLKEYVRIQRNVPSKVKSNLKKVQEELMKIVRRKRPKEIKISVTKSPQQSDKSSSPKMSTDATYNIYETMEKEKKEDRSAPQSVGTKGTVPSDAQVWFEALTSADLYKFLTEMKLGKMAISCRDNSLDGSFFRTISDQELENEFQLSRIQLLKFRKLQKERWVPNN